MPTVQSIAGLGVESSITPDVEIYLGHLRRCCDMDGPERQGLEVFRPTWLKMVIKIAKASREFDANGQGPQVHKEWEKDPGAAYAWLKGEFRQRRDRDATAKTDHVFGDVATVIADMSTEQQRTMADLMGRATGGDPICRSARRWVRRHDALAEMDNLIDRQQTIMHDLENCELDERRRSLLREEGDRIGERLDELEVVYEQNGGTKV